MRAVILCEGCWGYGHKHGLTCVRCAGAGWFEGPEESAEQIDHKHGAIGGCPYCVGTGTVEVEYCRSSIALEPSYREECCWRCGGYGYVDLTPAQLEVWAQLNDGRVPAHGCEMAAWMETFDGLYAWTTYLENGEVPQTEKGKELCVA